MNKQNHYYLGLDIGTDSVGYAATDDRYGLLKYKGEPMWGVHLFDEAFLNDERRGFRSARRRIDRRQQRVKLVQELFANEIAKVDINFYRRIQESALWREDSHDAYCLFADEEYSDKDYHKQYPTIHHLICELMEDPKPHDVRLVYLACAWLTAHRGHFFSDVSKDNIDAVLDISDIYQDLMGFFGQNKPWDCEPKAFGVVLKKNIGITAKQKELCMLLYQKPKAPKTELAEDEPYYCTELMLKLLCGGECSAKSLFDNDEYDDIKISLHKSDDDLEELFSKLGDDSELIIRLKTLYDWAILANILGGTRYISEKKVDIYNKHQSDLKALKQLICKYAPQKYRDVFRDESKNGYASYRKSGKQEDFCKFIKSILKDVKPQKSDIALFEDIMARLEDNNLCPKQVNSDNRVIPYQVYWIELKKILDNASAYLPFLNEADADGYITKEKLLSIMEFRVPYYVGPLNRMSDFAWFERKANGRILPWNFEEMVDLNKSEQAFIDRMTNSCTYLPNADVLPKCSLLHEKFQVLNEINTLNVNGQRISVDLKQRIYLDLFAKRKKVTVKAIKTYLLENGFYTKDDLDTLGGMDETVKSALSSHHAFRNLLHTGQLTENDAEEIIRHATYTEDRSRFTGWVNQTYPMLSEDDRKYISHLKFKDFARLSKELLCDVYGTEEDSETGEAMSIIDRMWNENLNLMEILSDRYTYRAQIQAINEDYYREHPKSLDERMKEMCISNAVKRPIIRTLDIVSDVVKVNGCAPKKIFIEMARGGKPEDKGNRTKSRYQQLKELYAKCDLELAREMEAQLDAMGEDRDSRLQSEKLFLYFLQLGRSMYSDAPIDFTHLSDKSYDIDHIYPQSKVKDDSILNNKVLVLSSENGAKGDIYPIKADIRHKMQGWWKMLHDHGLITTEKYKRLTRHTPFDENEEWGFINRQLVETTQSTKAAAAFLKERYPDTEIVYAKAGMVSEFRQKFDMLKCRSVNDLHHAKDAYLNIVVGNVYNEQFTKKWFMEHRDSYNLKVKTLFSRQINVGGRTIWNGSESLGMVKNTVQNKNAVHLTRYAFCRKGGFFNQQPEPAAPGLVPRKDCLTAEKYGGYNNKTAHGFILARFTVNQKTEIMLVVIDLIDAQKLSTPQTAHEYIQQQIEAILEKPINDLNLPLGLRVVKLHTMFDFDGIRMSIASKSNKGRTLVFSVNTQLIIGYSNERYIKRLERYHEKKKEHPWMVYSQEFDQISPEENVKLYLLLTEKLQNSVFEFRPANPYDTLQKGENAFKKLDIDTQVKVLLQIITVFGRNTSSCNLSAVGGKPKTATPTLSSSLSNWKKNYKNVRIIDQSASGLFETKSDNLLDLL